MSEHIPESQNNETHQMSEHAFSELLEGATLLPLAYDELPKGAREYFESKSEQYHPKDQYRPNDFTSLAKIVHADGQVTYVAEGIQYWANNEIGEVVYFVDYVDGVPAGHAELCRNQNITHGERRNAPYVGSFRTYDESDHESEGKNFRHRGLGTKRVMEMDAYARARFGMVLDSDTHLVHDSVDEHGVMQSSMERIWQRLVQSGKAEAYVWAKDANGNDRIAYRMKEE